MLLALLASDLQPQVCCISIPRGLTDEQCMFAGHFQSDAAQQPVLHQPHEDHSHVLSEQVTLEAFENFAHLRQDVHKLAVALEFYHNTVGHLREEDFQRAAKKITGKDIGKEIVALTFAMFDTDSDGDLSPQELLEVLRRREGNSSYGAYSIERQETGATGLYKCFISCITQRTGSAP